MALTERLPSKNTQFLVDAGVGDETDCRGLKILAP